MKRGEIRKSRKAVFFSTDALIALLIILLVVLVVYPVMKYAKHESVLEKDVIGVLSSLKIGEIDNSYVQGLISNEVITDLNKSVLEQIGEFYITDRSLARNLSEIMLSYLNTGENIGLWYGSVLLASINSSSYEEAENIETARQVISGIEEGMNLTGFSARAYLTSNLQSKYFYFGGYVGDGNLSVIVNYTGSLIKTDLEIAANTNFTICVNDDPCSGHFQPFDSEFEPKFFGSLALNLASGYNIVKFAPKNPEERLYIAGGYLKVSYNDSGRYEQAERYYFPGIEGIINLYDGFYVPSNLSSMEIYLHYNSNNNSLFLIIGNETVYNETLAGEQEETITDAVLRTKINYNETIRKTIPLRLGLSEVSGTVGAGTGVADIVFLVDSTGSMGQEISDVRDIVENFTQILENSSIDYRLGLIEFKDYPVQPCGRSSDFPYLIHGFVEGQFTTNATEFRNTVNSLVATGGADLPESHLRAINESLTLSWRGNAVKYNIMLTDAPPHALDCLEYNWWWYCPGNPPVWCWWCPTCGLADNDVACNLGPKSVEDMTYKLVENDITFFYVNKQSGLCDNNITAYNMTNETGGKYYEYTESEGVQDIILDIAGGIVNLTYVEQTAIVTGNLSTILYPDSYIEFNYIKPAIPYGLITTAEEQFYNNYDGSFSIPSGSEIVEVVAVSYSGPRWTNSVEINGVSIYNLSNYGKEYIKLGDPYNFYIPNLYIGQNNDVRITTVVSSQNSTYGSQYNKIIYTVRQNVSSFSPISASVDGCIWHLEFKDGSNINVSSPVTYSGTEHCYYTSAGNSVSNENDAMQTAVLNLLTLLDFNQDNQLDVKFTEHDLQISSSQITGIPYTWSTEVQVKRWD